MICVVSRAGDQRGAEVGDLHVGRLAGVQDVAGLDVAVRDALHVRVVERARALEHDLDDLLDRQQLLRRAEPLQRAAGDVLHDDVAGVLADAGVVDLADVRMRELAGERGLGEEELAEQLAARRVAQRFREDATFTATSRVRNGSLHRKTSEVAPSPELAHDRVLADLLQIQRRAHSCARARGLAHLRRRGAADVVARGDRAFQA